MWLYYEALRLARGLVLVWTPQNKQRYGLSQQVVVLVTTKAIAFCNYVYTVSDGRSAISRKTPMK